jgi:hypothetical protein
MRTSSPARPSIVCATAWLIACAWCQPARAQCTTAVYSMPGNPDFGAAIAVDGDLALIGDPTGEAAGVAWLLERGPFTWKSAAKFQPEPGTPGDSRYGTAVAVRGDIAVVGAPREAGAAGVVYVYRKQAGGWVLQVRMLAPDAAPHAEFGAALALGEQRLVVGAPADDQAGQDCGAVYVFELGPQGWQPGQKLLGAGVLPGERMGASLALDGPLLAAGTRSAGWIWLFESGPAGFVGEAVLQLPGAGQFGHSLSLRGERLLAGSPGTHATGIQSGAAHLYERVHDAWGLVATFQPPEPMHFARYGASVALDDALVVIGAPAAMTGEGVLYTYRQQAGAWKPGPTFSALAGPDYAGLGGALQVSGDVLVANASAMFGPPGAVYMLGGLRPWEPLGGAVAGWWGAPLLEVQGVLCGGSALTLTVSGGNASAPVLYVMGFSAVQLPFHGGTLWPAPDVLRYGVLDAAGRSSLSGTWPIAQPGMQPVYVQAWIADPTAPAGLAGSGGLRASTP